MLLRASDLVVRHHPSLPPAVAGATIHVSAGEVVGVVGPNGSGKSTLARALVGLVELEAGSVAGPAGRPPRVGLLLQDPAAQLVAVTVADEVALGPEGSGAAPTEVSVTVAAILERHGLVALRAHDPLGLSGGQQQRVAVAAVTACDVDVLVLDEPTALLDPAARLQLAASVRELAGGRGVIWVTQEPDELAWCDRVVALDAGAVVWDGPTSHYVAEPGIAATLGLELPAAARIALELERMGSWPVAAGIPVDTRALVDVLVSGRGDGG